MDLEARLHGAAPSEHPEALRLWLRLLTCTLYCCSPVMSLDVMIYRQG